MAAIVFTTGPAAGRRRALDGGEVVIGRHSDCHVFLPDPYASRRHARLYREGARWVAEDLGSRAGTRVNGARIHRPVLLEDGDELKLARSTCRVELPSDRDLARGEAAPSAVGFEEPRVYVRGEVPAGGDPLGPSESGAMRVFEAKLRALRGILSLASASDPDVFFETLAAELLQVFPRARSAFVLTPDERRGELEIRALHSRVGEGASSEIPRALLAELDERKGGILLGEGRDAAGAPAQRVVEPLGMRMGAVIPGREANAGALYVEAAEPVLGREDADLLAAVAAYAGLSLEAKEMRSQLSRRHQLERDLRMARKIQRSLLPDPGAYRRAGLDIGVHYAPAHEVGGDFYDLLWQGRGRLAIAVGDVAGKAVSGALYMAMLTAELRARAASAPSPGELLAAVDRAMYGLGEAGMFATLIYAVLDLERGELVFANAGHIAPLLRRQGEVVPIHAERAHAPPVGVAPGAAAGEAKIALSPGDSLLFSTDGIHEARDHGGGEYGFERLARRFSASPPTPEGVVADVLGDVRDHVAHGRQGDDITLVAINVGRACREGRRVA